MVQSFEVGAYVLAAFLTLYGLFFFWISYHEPPPARKGIASLIQPKLLFLLFTALYLALAHFTIYTAMTLGIEWGWHAPCENVIINSTIVSSTLTTYSYGDSCVDRVIPPVANSLHTVFSWILWIDIFTLVIGSMMLFARKMSEW